MRWLQISLLVMTLNAVGPTSAIADPTLKMTWTHTDGTGTVGSDVIYADPGDTLRLLVSVVDDGTGLSEAELELSWDSSDLVGQNPVECPTPENTTVGLCDSGTVPNSLAVSLPSPDATIGTGSAGTFNAAVTNSVPFTGEMDLAAVEFVVQPSATVETVSALASNVTEWNALSYSPSAAGTIVVTRPNLTDTIHISLAASQIESGGDLTENPDVTGGAGGALIPYTASGSFTCCGPDYLEDNLDDGDVGLGQASDGLYAIPDGETFSIPGSGSLVLDFGTTRAVGSIAIYNGYTNRDDGSYTLRDGSGTLLGSWTITTLEGSNDNEDADSFWLVLDTPVSTDSLTLEFVSSDAQSTVSFREIQVMAPTSVPAASLIGRIALAALLLVATSHSFGRLRSED